MRPFGNYVIFVWHQAEGTGKECITFVEIWCCDEYSNLNRVWQEKEDQFISKGQDSN